MHERFKIEFEVAAHSIVFLLYSLSTLKKFQLEKLSEAASASGIASGSFLELFVSGKIIGCSGPDFRCVANAALAGAASAYSIFLINDSRPSAAAIQAFVRMAWPLFQKTGIHSLEKCYKKRLQAGSAARAATSM